VQVIGACLRCTGRWDELIDGGFGAIRSADPTKDIQRICKPSYLFLPMHLKRAFVSFAAYPKGAHVSGEELVSLWGASALVPDARAYERARKQLEHLVAAYLVERTESRGSHSSLKQEGYFMHDILWDMAAACAQADFPGCCFSNEQVRPLKCL
jgi:hypothetical protein